MPVHMPRTLSAGVVILRKTASGSRYLLLHAFRTRAFPREVGESPGEAPFEAPAVRP